jgi:hypothetical protein
MPALGVLVDDQLIARVRTDGLDVLTVRVSGTKIDELFATLDVSGGSYPENAPFTHLVWLSEFKLQPGQRIRVEFSEEGETLHAGKTLEELFPESSEEKHGPMPGRAQLVDEVRKHVRVREHYGFSVRSSGGASASAEAAPNEHGFGVSVLWDWVRPERVSASLHTYTLEQLASNEDSNYHFQERLPVGSWVEVRVDA